MMRTAIAAASGTETLLRSAIIDGFEQANAAVRELGVGAGSTLAVVQVEGLTIRPYHVGDCEILVTGSRGKIKLQTVSHSPVGYGVEAGLLDKSEAMVHEDRHIVSNIIGSEDMRIEIGPPRTLQRRDTVLLASDGLFDNLSTDEIVAHIRKGPLPQSAGALCIALRRRMTGAEDGHPSKPDDATFIAFRRQ
jgi:serine/threonine protein phosphatase PrpC